MKKKLIKYLIFQGVSLVVIGTAVRWNHNLLLFPGTWAKEASEALNVPQGGKVLYRKIGDKPEDVVEALYMPAFGTSRGVVVFAHGNAMLIDEFTEFLQYYTKILNYDVLAVEFRGYGRSGGRPSQAKIVDDFRHFYDLMTLERKASGGQTVFHGWSLGGGIVADLSRTRSPDKVILNSTLESLARLGKDRSGLPKSVFQFFFPTEIKTLEWLQSLDRPVQIHHGRDDKVIGPEHGQLLKNGLRKSEFFLHDGGHTDSPRDWETYWQQVEAFLRY